jgi:tungstate transport system ATP-binding protein
MYYIIHLKKNYGKRTVLDIPDLEIPGKRIYGLLGPNGAGKTTLLNILGFLDSPSWGQIRYNGQAVQFVEKDLQKLRKRVSLVDQFPILFTTTVYRNMEFGLKLRKIEKGKRRKIIEGALDLVGMRDFTDAPAHRLSGGETQRVALARALVLSPSVLLCDEPTSSVDVENQNLIINILRRINEQKKITVIFTTHDKMQAVRLAHQTLVLDKGRVLSTGYENIFSARIDKKQNGTFQCHINGSLNFKISSNQMPGRNKKARVIIDPEKITLLREQMVEGAPPELTGRVITVMEQDHHIRVVIDTGTWLTVLMSQEDYMRISPQVGKIIGFLIPSHAVHVLN